ncbi:MAG: rhomboid family intramembrane serine protease [Thermofilum sp.]
MVYGYPSGFEEVEHRRSLVTVALILVNVAVYLATSWRNGFTAISEEWLQAGAFVPALLSQPDQWYRLFTSMFLHANLLHIFFNMLFLYFFGKHVERVLGPANYLALYMASGLLAEVFHTAFLPLEGETSAFIPALGASGAISGVLGAYLLMFPGTKLSMCVFYFFIPICFTTRAYAYLIFWFATQVLQGYLGASLGVAVFAHAGGFIGGLALLPLLLRSERVEALRVYASLRRFFFDVFFVKPGLSSFAKAVLTALLLSVAAGAVYSASAASSARTVSKVLGVSVSYQDVVESESVIVQLSDGSVSFTPITSSGVRVVVNRLSAMNLLFDEKYAGRTVSVDESRRVRVQGVPVQVQLKAQLSYDEWGLLTSGRGSMVTDVLQCSYYGCVVGERQAFSFEATTEKSWVGYEGIPVVELSVVSLAVCLAAILAVARAEHYEIAPSS